MPNKLPTITPDDLDETIMEGDRKVRRYGASTKPGVYLDRDDNYHEVRLVGAKKEAASEAV